MKGRFDFGNAEIDVETEARPLRREVEPDSPFKVLLLGNFSGRKKGIAASVKQARPIRLDRDNFAEVMGIMQAGVEIPMISGEGTSQIYPVRELDDFHPDQLYQKLPLFQALRELRRELQSPSNFPSAAEKIQKWAGADLTAAEAKSPAKPDPQLASLTPDQLLRQMLGEDISEAVSSSPPPSKDNWQEFLGRIVAPHLRPGVDARQPLLLARLDEAVSALMRRVLHDPAFQRLEALWRGLFFLVSRLETEENLQLWVLDLSRDELFDDLSNWDNLPLSRLYGLLIKEALETPGASPWTVVAGLFDVGGDVREIALLGRMGRLAAFGQFPFLAGASARLLGIDSFVQVPEDVKWQASGKLAEAWQELRRLPQSDSLVLVLPRFLVRLPYGRQTDATERFDFEEMSVPAAHEDFLWIPPAVASVYLMGEAFCRNGWQFRPGEVQQIDGLPFYMQEDGGEKRVQPCAEILMTMEIAEKILESGIMPLLSFKDRDYIRLAGFQAISDPPAPLRGSWNAGH